MRLADRRVEAVDEGHGGLAARFGGGGGERFRLGRVEGKGLFADHVLVRGERRLGQRPVKMIRRADMDDVDVVHGDQLLGGACGALGAELAGGCPGAVRGRGRHRGQVRAGQQGGASVNATNEAAADDPDAEALGCHLRDRIPNLVQLSSKSWW